MSAAVPSQWPIGTAAAAGQSTPVAAAAPRRRALLSVLVALLAVLPYLNALRAGFVFDDIPTIRDNPAVTGGIDVIRMLTTTLFGVTYRPLTLLSFALNQALAPGNAAAFHAVNLVLHAAVSVLVFALALRLFASLRVAALAAALFAVHPIHTEAVTSLVGRAELLAALWGLLCLLGALRADAAAGRGGRRGWQAVSLGSFALALLSKESAVTLLALLPLVRVTGRREPLRAGLLRELGSLDWVPYVLCTAAFVGLRTWVIGALTAQKITPLDNVLAFVPASVRVRSALGVLWDYFGLLNVPLVLSADYSYAQVPVVRSWLAPRCLAGVGLIAVAGGVALRNRRPAVTLAALWPFVALLTTANVFFAIPTAKAERLLYFPSIGWSLLVAYGCGRLATVPRHRRAVGVAVCAVVGLFGWRTWVRNRDWRDDAALYGSMVRSAPDSAKARYDFGIVLLEAKQYDAAIAQLRRALAIYPWWERPATGIGLAFERRGSAGRAAAWYERALRIKPASQEAAMRLCGLLVRQGEATHAAAACRRGLRYHPANPELIEGLRRSLVHQVTG